MTIQYEIKETESGDIIIRHNEDGTISSFLAHPANSDYQAYLDRDKPKAALSTPIVSSDAD
jgi:hypothetical protein